MKKKYQSIVLFAYLVIVFAGCSTEEIARYDQSFRVVFVSVDGDNYTNFSKNYNFKAIFSTVLYDSIQVRIQGVALDQDLQVYLKMNQVEGYDLPEMKFINNPATIAAGEYTSTFYFEIKNPISVDQNRCSLVIDYETSGLEPGIIERSKFNISVLDQFKYEWGAENFLKITLDEYNTHIAPLLGPPSMIKIRFFVEYSTLASNYPEGLKDYLWFIQEGQSARLLTAVTNAINAYNRANPDNPLTDENGNLVTLP